MSETRPPKQVTPSDVADGAKRVANDAADNPWVARFMRFGHVARGMIYGVVGLLALRLSLGIRDAAMSQSGALAVIGRQPFGNVLLIAMSVGLASYALWGVIRAVADPNHEGRSRGGKAKRAGFAFSALAYAGLAVLTIGFVVGNRPDTDSPYGMTAWLLSKPFGAWLLGILGIGCIAYALLQIARAWRGDFERNLELGHRSRAERRWAMGLGRVGITTRSIVLTIIGIFLVAAALHADPNQSTGFDGALLEVAKQPFGRTLLAAVGLGLVSFGAFSIMCARWMRIGSAATASKSQKIQSSVEVPS